MVNIILPNHLTQPNIVISEYYKFTESTVDDLGHPPLFAQLFKSVKSYIEQLNFC